MVVNPGKMLRHCLCYAKNATDLTVDQDQEDLVQFPVGPDAAVADLVVSLCYEQLMSS